MTSERLLGLAEGGGEDGPHGSPDSATRGLSNVKRFPWGKFGVLLLGEEETYSGDFGESRGVGARAVTLLRQCRAGQVKHKVPRLRLG